MFYVQYELIQQTFCNHVNDTNMKDHILNYFIDTKCTQGVLLSVDTESR